MIIYYRFNNFCSFYCENEFSMCAPGGKVMRRFPDNYTNFHDGFEILKSAVIVGENAGGKSNFINSLKYLKSLFISNSRVRSVRSYVNAVSLKCEERPIQEFEICFKTECEKVYVYHLHIDEHGIVKEKLEIQKGKKSKRIKIFAYDRMEKNLVTEAFSERIWAYASKLYEMQSMQQNNSNLGLFVSKLALLGNEDAVETVKWFTERLCPENVDIHEFKDIFKVENDLKILKDDRYLEIFRMVDYSICGLELDEERPYSKSIIIRKNDEGEIFRQKLEMDSTGVREFFCWAIQIFKVVYENKVVFADEMDRVLNPVLSERVIAFINGTEHKGQFIFTTHNVLHLDLKKYMKEQIYFITKKREQLTSEIYSLSDFPEIRYETTKIYDFYVKGILGGISFE